MNLGQPPTKNLPLKQATRESTRFPGRPSSLRDCGLALRLERSAYSRYKIWSVQKRSRRCSALFSTANSSAAMPPYDQRQGLEVVRLDVVGTCLTFCRLDRLRDGLHHDAPVWLCIFVGNEALFPRSLCHQTTSHDLRSA